MPAIPEFTLQFRINNAAFDDPGEIPRILRKVADAVAGGSGLGTVYDSNGNRVGDYWMDDRDDA